MVESVDTIGLNPIDYNSRAGSIPAIPTEIAWAAGLFEGEGCIYKAVMKKKYIYIRLNVTSTDLDVLQKFHSIVRYGKIYNKTVQAHCKPAYAWQLQKSSDQIDEVKNIIMLFEPYLGRRRRAKAVELGILC